MNKNQCVGNKSECCGCGVCHNVCPFNAIAMKEDEEGFLYPVVEESKCKHCGRCVTYCAFATRERQNFNHECAYLATHNDINVRMHSRSGGVFVACSDVIMSLDGVIYGSVMTDDNTVHHIRVSRHSEISKLCKSKYVQSDTSDIWLSIADDLKKGLTVLFSGTPCQVDALYSFCKSTKTPLERLYTMDLICHGVPSPMLFREYVAYLEKKFHGKLSCFDFRDKTVHGWDDHYETFVINRKKYVSEEWREVFYTNCCLRPSCYKCKYSTTKRYGDLTFGDAWGVRTCRPDLYDNKGISVLLINSEKGQSLLERIQDICHITEVDFAGVNQYIVKSKSFEKFD